MRILFVSGCYLPTINGVTYHIQLLKKALEARGHTVFLLAPSTLGYKDHEKNILRYPAIPNPIFPSLPIGLPIYSMEEIKKLKLNIVHTHHPFVASTLAIQIAETLKIPLFWTNHTRYEEYFNHYLPSLSGLSHHALSIHLKSVASKCQKVICPSPIAVKILKNYGITNTQTVYNGIDTSNFIPKKNDSKTLNLVYVGRVEKEKNIHFMLDISKHLKKLIPEFKLSIVGDGKEIAIFQDNVNQENLSDNVILLGSLPREKLISIYQSAHIFISPSNTEVMPLTFIEALSSGLPIFCLKSSGVDKFLPKSPAIISLSANPKNFAKKIHELFNSSSLSNLSTIARNLGAQFDISTTAQNLELIYAWHLGQK